MRCKAFLCFFLGCLFFFPGMAQWVMYLTANLKDRLWPRSESARRQASFRVGASRLMELCLTAILLVKLKSQGSIIPIERRTHFFRVFLLLTPVFSGQICSHATCHGQVCDAPGCVFKIFGDIQMFLLNLRYYWQIYRDKQKQYQRLNDMCTFV